MKRVRAALRGAEQDLRELGRRFALAGGFAVSVRTQPRTTRDVDFVVATLGDPDAEQLVADMVARGYRVLTAVEQTAASRLATVRLQSSAGAVVDLLFASTGVESEIVEASELLEVLRGIHIAVPTVGHLIAMKVLSRNDRERPQDRVDLAELFKCATADDLVEAQGALDLITRRGFHRKLDLNAAFAQARAELGP